MEGIRRERDKIIMDYLNKVMYNRKRKLKELKEVREVTSELEIYEGDEDEGGGMNGDSVSTSVHILG